MADKKRYLGIDAGGTKTHCLIGDATGKILGFGAAGAGNYEAYGVEAADREIRSAVDAALSTAGCTMADIAGVGLGIAGADIPEDYTMLEERIFTPIFGEIPRVFRNDSMGGLRGGAREPFGVVIACGTGCVAAGINRDGIDTRVGGISGDYGDMVSGSSIGSEGLYAIWRARDGIRPPTLLTDLFVRRAGAADIDDLFQAMYREEITPNDLEPMAKLVFDAAWDGDPTACDILEWGGRYLGEMVNGVARNLKMTRDTFDVVMAGSVFKGRSPVLKDAMQTIIHRECPAARLIMPRFEPVVGTLLLGMELDQVIDSAIYESLARALKRAESLYGIRLSSE